MSEYSKPCSVAEACSFPTSYSFPSSSSSDDDDEEEEELLACLAAIQGSKVPSQAQLKKSPTVMNATIHGIRHHDHFARSSHVVAACANYIALVRARNARLIMSDEIPPNQYMHDPEAQPYCIWHPQVASEETYRLLARQYPSMRYQVGRACAVAGYAGLYHELDLLPDVSIAEEARDSATAGSLEILHDIVDRRIRFAVMDDYTRKIQIDEPRGGACMNGDTAVSTSLAVRRDVREIFGKVPVSTLYPYHGSGHYFDIEEDGGIGAYSSMEATAQRDDLKTRRETLTEEQAALLYLPLPVDLPPMASKDVLIHMAAYEGNVDRYARLRRPFMIKDELYCVIRGIYHNTTFAKWWSLQLKSLGDGLRSDQGSISAAINARFIMNNDLSRVSTVTSSTPYLIWYPLWPRYQTLAQLAILRPDMKLQIAHACIVADYRSVYSSLDFKPNWMLWRETENHGHGAFYREDLERRARDMGFDVTNYASKAEPDYNNIWCTNLDKEPSDNWLHANIAALELTSDQGCVGIYDGGMQANAAEYNLFICSPEQLRKEVAEQYDTGHLYLYHEYD